jgi:hypothetical protein
LADYKAKEKGRLPLSRDGIEQNNKRLAGKIEAAHHAVVKPCKFCF